MIIRNWDFWGATLLPYSDWYLLFSGLIWGMIFLIGAAGIWSGWETARKGLLILAPVYTSYLWIERFVLALINTSLPDWPFFLALTIVILAWAYWVLTREVVKQFFGENIYEQ